MSALEFTRFCEMQNWSILHNSLNKLVYNKKYNIVKLGYVLSKSDIKWVDIKDNEKYPILGVHAQGVGVYINRITNGKELTMKRYQKSKSYHLFYCKVRTVKGQWGVVYPKYENSYGSSNMQYLKIDLQKIQPEYLELLLKVKKITDEWDKNAIGADGRHFNLGTLLSLKIPLPELEEQKEIVNKIQKYAKELDTLKKEHSKLLTIFKDTIFKSREIETNIFNIIGFNDLTSWSVQNLSQNNFNYKNTYNLEKIGTFIKRNKTKLEIQDKTKYKRVTIKIRNNGVCIRDEVMGKDIGTKKQFLIKEGQFLLSKIDARNGAFGIATEELDGAIITADFFAYDIDVNKIYPYFLSLITTTERFIQFAQNSSTGTTNRQRLKEELFLDVKIPLPTVDEQKQLVRYLENNLLKQEKISELKQTALQEFEKEIFDEA